MDKLAKTISIHAICEMEVINNNKESVFDYNIDLDIDGTGVIILTPTDSNVIFRDAYLISSFDDTDTKNEYSRIFAINLVANMELTNTEDDDYEIGIDDVGQVTITPYAAFDGVEGHAKFVSFEIEKDSSLITEEIESDSEDTGIESISAEVLDEDIGEEEEPAWEITYELPLTEDVEDNEDTESPDNVEIIHAPDAETAVKYAEQNARIKAKEEPNWAQAEIVQIKKQ